MRLNLFNKYFKMGQLSSYDFWSDRSDLRVNIRVEHYPKLPFSLESRNGVAIVFSYFGDSEEVSCFMQTASHMTRAYYINAKGLKGFLVPYSIVKDLREAMANGQLRKVTDGFKVNLKYLIEFISKMKTNKHRLNFLGERYPDLCIFVMKKRGMQDELQEYMDRCRSYENDPERYTLYIRGYWLPYLQQQKDKGLLKEGGQSLICFD